MTSFQRNGLAMLASAAAALTAAAGCDDYADVIRLGPDGASGGSAGSANGAGGIAGQGGDAGGTGGSGGTAGAGGAGGAAGMGDGGSGNPRYAPLAAAIEARRVEKSVPGVAVAVVENGQLAWSVAFGKKSALGVDLVEPTTLFPAGMLSVTLTGIGALLLVEASQLDLDTPVQYYVPEMSFSLKPEWAPLLTPRHLLDVRSGMPLWTTPPSPWSGTDAVLLMDWVENGLEVHVPLLFSPGTLALWSNSDPTLLAALIERTSSKTFADYTKQSVLTPLGMTRTMFGSEAVLADGDYARSNASLATFDGAVPQPIYAFSNVLDLAKLLEFFLNGDDAVLSTARREEMMSPQSPSSLYLDKVHEGFAAMLVADGISSAGYYYPFDVRTVGNATDLNGYSSCYLMVPSRGFGMVMLANASGFADAADVIQTAMTTLLGFPKVDAVAKGAEDPSTFGRYAGQYDTVDTTGPITVSWSAGVLHAEWKNGNKSCDLTPGYPRSFDCPAVTGQSVSFVDGSGGDPEWITSFSFVGHKVTDGDGGVMDAAAE